MAEQGHFDRTFLAFLRELEKNNNTEWFHANKTRFQERVQVPALDFIRALAPLIGRITKQIVCSDSKVGGSMLRINRDIRFSADKRPYNTDVKMRFAHAISRKKKDIAAPGFYLELTPKRVTLGTGVYRPEADSLLKIRKYLVKNGAKWKRVRDDKKFRAIFPKLHGESLKRPPKGFDPNHPLVEDLKRKDFVAFADLPASALTKDDFLATVAGAYKSSSKFVGLLCEALGLSY